MTYTPISNYESAEAALANNRDKNKRKLERNTYLERRGDNFAIRLHQTDVVTYKPDDSIVLNSGGWLTMTTKARINQFLPAGINLASDRGQWIVRERDTYINEPTEENPWHSRVEPGTWSAPYSDGITLYGPDYKPSSEVLASAAEIEVNEAERKEINKKIAKYLKPLPELITVLAEKVSYDTLPLVGDVSRGTTPEEVKTTWNKRFENKYLSSRIVIEALQRKGITEQQIKFWIRANFGIKEAVLEYLRSELYPDSFATKHGRHPLDVKVDPVIYIPDVANAHYNSEEVPEFVLSPVTGDIIAKTNYHSSDAWRGWWEVEPVEGWRKVGDGCNVGDWPDAPSGCSDRECKEEINQFAEQYGEVYVVLCGGSNVMAMQYEVLARAS